LYTSYRMNKKRLKTPLAYEQLFNQKGVLSMDQKLKLWFTEHQTEDYGITFR